MGLQTIARPSEGYITRQGSENLATVAAQATTWEEKASWLGIDPTFLYAFPYMFSTNETAEGGGYRRIQTSTQRTFTPLLSRQQRYIVPDAEIFALPYASMLSVIAGKICYETQYSSKEYPAALQVPDEKLLEDLQEVYGYIDPHNIEGDANNEIAIAMAVKGYLERNGLFYQDIADVTLPAIKKGEVYRFRFSHLVRMIEESMRLAKTNENALRLPDNLEVIGGRFF